MNPYDLRSEYHYSDIDARHLLSSYAVVTLPWGIEVSGILRTRSGLPLNPIVGSDTDGNATNTDRPYKAVGVPFLRNEFRNRGVVTNNDLRILKSFNLGSERYRVQLSAEFFNLFNLDNVVYAGQANIYGPGINPTTGAAAPSIPASCCCATRPATTTSRPRRRWAIRSRRSSASAFSSEDAHLFAAARTPSGPPRRFLSARPARPALSSMAWRS